MTNETSKFSIGQKVQIRPDLKVGAEYYNENGKIYEVFTPRMSKNLGKEAKIIGREFGRYVLDIDKTDVYTEEMLRLPVDKLATEEYKFDVSVENLVAHMIKQVPDQLINHAIKTGNKELFKQVSEKYYSDEK